MATQADEIETAARDIVRNHRDAVASHEDDLSDAIRKAITEAVERETARKVVEPAVFFVALQRVTHAAMTVDPDYTDAWEEFVRLLGYDPHWAPPREPATCGPLLQWDDVSCRLHGTDQEWTRWAGPIVARVRRGVGGRCFWYEFGVGGPKGTIVACGSNASTARFDRDDPDVPLDAEHRSPAMCMEACDEAMKEWHAKIGEAL